MTYQDENLRDDPDHDVDAIPAAASAHHGGPMPEAAERRARYRLISERRLRLRAIVAPYGLQEELHDALDEAMCGADELRAAGLLQPAVHLLADSFSGKSSGARRYVREVLGRGEHRPGTIPVAYAKLDTDGTVGSLATDILTALGQPRPNALTPDKRWLRARQAIRDCGVRLLILDEFQRAGRRPTISPVIGGKILDIMDGDGIMDRDAVQGGDCAVAFLGKHNAINVFKACPDLRNRLDGPVQMPKLIWRRERADFIAFAKGFDHALVDARTLSLPAGLDEEETAQLLLEASGDLIGRFARIVDTAVIAMTRDGHGAITRQDLSDAVDDWAIANGHIGYNPFVKSYQELDAREKENGDDAGGDGDRAVGDAENDEGENPFAAEDEA